LDVERDVGSMATEQLEAETCTLAAQLAAATCRFLLLVGELARREAWRSWGCRSLAHWLSWQCGLGLHAAREHVRVATALPSLPAVTEAFARGELSYSKVRALTRITGVDDRAERELVEFARAATAAQLERTVGAYRGVVRRADPSTDRERTAVRRTFHDDGTVTISAAHLDADAAALVWQALETARADMPAADGVSAETSRADALERMARRTSQPDAAAAPAVELVVHTDVDLRVGIEQHGGFQLALDAVRRLGCDAWVRHVTDTSADAGRRHRKVPRRLRRAVLRRDGHRCRFPGCEHRGWLHTHHIEHWVDGGATDLANLVLLCGYHHRLVHEGGWTVEGDPNHHVVFVAPDSRRIDEDHRANVPRTDWRALTQRYGRPDPATLRAHGERLDLDLTITALCCLVPPDRN
jgi:hypothetical protein